MDQDLALALTILDLKWVTFSIAASVSTLRYHLRLSRNRRLDPDDWIHAGALTLCFVYAIVTSVESQLHAEQTDPSLELQQLWFAIRTCYHIFYWLTVFACKAVFLALYKGIFGVSRRFLYAWWATVVITFLAFIVAMVSNFLTCGMAPGSYTFDNCQNMYFSTAIQVARVVPPMSIVSNVLTDLLLILLPALMIPQLHLHRAQVRRLVPIILLALVTLIFTIASWTMHAVVVPGKAGSFAADLLLNLEPIVGVIVSALPAVLFVRNDSGAVGRQRQRQRERQRLRGEENGQHAAPQWSVDLAAVPVSDRTRAKWYQRSESSAATAAASASSHARSTAAGNNTTTTTTVRNPSDDIDALQSHHV